MVTANVGHNEMSHFVSGEVRAVTSNMQRLKHSWTFQLGPFAEHTVEITKKYTLGTIVSLLVDGETFVEASAADLGCKDKDWQCNFRFLGERVIDFEVFKTNVNGTPTDETDHVRERRKYIHQCTVVIPNDKDLTTAMFFVDSQRFQDLTVAPIRREEKPLMLEPRALLQSYKISAPYKVDANAPTSLTLLSTSMRNGTGGLFGQCYVGCAPVEEADDVEVCDVQQVAE